MSEMDDKKFQKPRGTRDILPVEQPYWRYLVSNAEDVLYGLGFSKIDTPIFEDKDIYERGVGEGTDIVEKEIFSISEADNDEQKYALRPEGTAGTVRAFIENGMNFWPQPVRLFYYGQMFRRERPQKGRLREHRQIGVEIFGDESAKSDYLSIHSAISVLRKVGFSNFTVSINSIGCTECRPKYLTDLKKYYSNSLSKVCDDCRKRYNSNSLRLLDCKNEQCQETKKKAPEIINSLCKECRDHFQEVLGYLEDFEIKFSLDSMLVRGLDYYTKTVFEISASSDKDRTTTLCGGGRYDNLVSTLGGQKTPAVGWGMGIDRVIDELKKNNFNPPKIRGVEIFIIELSSSAKTACKKIYKQLLKEGMNVYYVPSNDSLRIQLKDADKLGASAVLIVGQEEAKANTAIVRNLRTGDQEILKIDNVTEKVKEKYLQ